MLLWGVGLKFQIQYLQRLCRLIGMRQVMTGSHHPRVMNGALIMHTQSDQGADSY